MSPALSSSSLDFTLFNETRGFNAVELVCQHRSTRSPLATRHPVWKACLQRPNSTASSSPSRVKPWSSPRRSRTSPSAIQAHPAASAAFPSVLCYHSQIAISNFFLPAILISNSLLIFLSEGKWNLGHNKSKHLPMR